MSIEQYGYVVGFISLRNSYYIEENDKLSSSFNLKNI